MKKRKFVWNISQKENLIVIELNGELTTMIDVTYSDTLQENKQAVINEIEFWSAIHKSEITGFEILQ